MAQIDISTPEMDSTYLKTPKLMYYNKGSDIKFKRSLTVTHRGGHIEFMQMRPQNTSN